MKLTAIVLFSAILLFQYPSRTLQGKWGKCCSCLKLKSHSLSPKSLSISEKSPSHNLEHPRAPSPVYESPSQNEYKRFRASSSRSEQSPEIASPKLRRRTKSLSFRRSKPNLQRSSTQIRILDHGILHPAPESPPMTLPTPELKELYERYDAALEKQMRKDERSKELERRMKENVSEPSSSPFTMDYSPSEFEGWRFRMTPSSTPNTFVSANSHFSDSSHLSNLNSPIESSISPRRHSIHSSNS